MEAATLELLAAHRALSHGGIGFVSRSIDDKAFILLDTIESLWAQGKQSPRTVWRCLDRLARVAQRSFVDEEFAVLSHASSLTSFSEFPIGLMTLPYDTAPLCCRVPIAYRPLVPLTRAVLVELSPESTAYLQGQLKVLVAECIPTDDIVGRLSRRGWATAGRRVSDVANLTLRVQEISSAAELRSALREDTYDLLVISAHGFVDRNQHRTGFLCGHERVVEEELGPLPPIVCLSACQVSPRGRGTTNITDLMFRQGARVILGTLVPIDVRRNALLMARFFANITEALQGKMPKNSFEAVWQFTMSSNAINDILSSNASLAYWALERQGGQSVIEEFMLYRSRGRLRPSHIYRDTEAVLRDMAKDRGILDRFDAWMHSQGYLPESLFYVVLGWPERIVFYDDQYEKLFNQKATPTSLTDG
ncbi:MAG TPA: CHAT domain-containing protein [Candidatus Tectomicrobia bacterium]